MSTNSGSNIATTTNSGFNSQSEFTDQSADMGGESSFDPSSYTSLKMKSDKGAKR